ncbi:hypothetical protein Btru_062512 [Bulinus truncatus]|nr:hypothetical protein Btru_062512 [Bulinus truncatus]
MTLFNLRSCRTMKSINVKLVSVCMTMAVFITISFYKSHGRFINGSVHSTYTYSKPVDIRRQPVRNAVDKTVNEISETPNSRTVDRQTDRSSGLVVLNKLPACIIIGVSKCGTRALLEYLKLHPEVAAANTEISYYYNETLRHRGLAWYASQMPEPGPSQMTVVKSPDCFQHPSCADHIHADNNLTKMIVLLRDPVERLVSQYMQLRDKHASFPTFEEWVTDDRTGGVNTKVTSIMVGAYFFHLTRWLAVFPREQFLIIQSESLKVNPLADMRTVEKFLGLTSFYSGEDFYFNSSRGFYCVRVRMTGKTRCLGKSKGREHIVVRRDVLDKLYDFYKPFSEKLDRLVGVNFNKN